MPMVQAQLSTRSLAGILITGGIALLTLAECQTPGGELQRKGEQHQPATQWSPLTTPQDATKHIRQAMTAASVDEYGAPVRPATRFTVDETIYVTFLVVGIEAGEGHRVSVRWFLNGTLAQQAGALRSMIVTHDGPAYFSFTYRAPGVGKVTLYWDEPIGDNNDAPNDAFLAQSLTFSIE
jgi:hypothetical protein